METCRNEIKPPKLNTILLDKLHKIAKEEHLEPNRTLLDNNSYLIGRTTWIFSSTN